MSKSDLCRALIAYASGEWRRALTARALCKYVEAADRHSVDPRNPITRARAWATRWHLEHAMAKLAKVDMLPVGSGYYGRCPKCDDGRTVYAVPGARAECLSCGWKGKARDFLIGRCVRGRSAPKVV